MADNDADDTKRTSRKKSRRLEVVEPSISSSFLAILDTVDCLVFILPTSARDGIDVGSARNEVHVSMTQIMMKADRHEELFIVAVQFGSGIVLMVGSDDHGQSEKK